MKRALLILLFLLPLIFAGCLTDSDSPENYEKGVVAWIPLEGGFWGIIADGKNYDPVNLPDQFKRDGIQVSFTYRIKNTGSFHQWGTIIEIIEIRSR
ncbi:MAG: hypothetical protein HUU43_01395 [Ignavibacteriaceae bacterium]|nr:hypothetical protein [Ignavibacteriaceae bacterium]